jgi:CRISPR-associated endonuclease/helicase Cas3
MTRLNRGVKAEIPALSWRECFAKSTEEGAPGLSVHEHSRNVAEVARALVSVLPAQVVALLGSSPVCTAALHDIGKVSPGFQLNHFRENLRSHVPQLGSHVPENYCTKHACISEAAVNAFLSGDASTTALGAVVGAHHGRRDDPGRDVFGVYGGAVPGADPGLLETAKRGKRSLPGARGHVPTL